MKQRRMIGAVTALLAAAMLIGGCSSQGKEAQAPAATPDAPATPKKDPAEIVLLLTGTATEADMMKSFGDKLKQKFPHVTLKFITADNKVTKMNEYLTTGQQIDLIVASINYTSEYVVDLGLNYDITDLIKKYQYDLSALEPSTVDIQHQVANGGMYGLPIGTSSFSLFYNKDIFDRFGVPYPKEGMTWDEMYALAQKMTRNEGGKQYYGFLISPLHYLLNNQLGLPMLDPKTNDALFTGDKYKAMIENLVRFYQIPGAETNKYLLTRDVAKNAIMFFNDKNVAMYAYLNGLRSEEMANMNWDIVSMPSYKEAPGVGSQSYPTYVYLSQTSKHKEQAFEMMSYLTSEEYQRYQSTDLAGVTILKNPDIMKNFAEGTAYADYYKGKNLKALIPEKYGPYSPKNQYTRVAEAPLAEAMQKIAKNQKDTNTALRETADKVAQEIQKLKK